MSVAIPVQPGEISQTRRAQSFYRPELDGLRFFAFFCVFIHHTLPTHIEFYLERHIPFGDFITSVAEAGRFGVDLFFVLSAYLITELLLREKENFGKVHLKSFYLRRMLRIWPLYFLAIAIATFLPHIDSTQTFPLRYVVAFLFLAGNWIVSFYDFPESVMNALWSVSFEEQFYLFWPAVIALVRRARTLGVADPGRCGMRFFNRLDVEQGTSPEVLPIGDLDELVCPPRSSGGRSSERSHSALASHRIERICPTGVGRTRGGALGIRGTFRRSRSRIYGTGLPGSRGGGRAHFHGSLEDAVGPALVEILRKNLLWLICISHAGFIYRAKTRRRLSSQLPAVFPVLVVGVDRYLCFGRVLVCVF